MDSKRILDRHSEEHPDRKVLHSFRLPGKLYKRFKAICKESNASAAKVLADLIAGFISDFEKKSKK